MKTVSALDVRKHFGRLLDEAAAGEHIVIERAGQPRAALVPLEVLEMIDPAAEIARKREAFDDLKRLARLRPASVEVASEAIVRQMRDEREAHISSTIADRRPPER